MPKNTRGVQVKQIAEHLGLSSGTVSIVLNGRGDELRISKETQKIVLDTAREMNYQSGKNQKKKSEDSRQEREILYWCILEPALYGRPFGTVLFRFFGDDKAVPCRSGNCSPAF